MIGMQTLNLHEYLIPAKYTVLAKQAKKRILKTFFPFVTVTPVNHPMKYTYNI